MRRLPPALVFAWVLAAAAFPAPACGAGAPDEEDAPPRPSLVLIVADDLGWADVGYHGAPSVGGLATPHLDALAREGIALERFYAQPVCSPARAALLTGRSPVRYGLQYSVLRPWSEGGLARSERTLAEHLRDAGYRTAAVGKWHLGHDERGLWPTARGFETFYGHLTSAIDYSTHEYAGIHDWQRDGRSVREEGYATDLLADEAVRWLGERAAGEPFFLYLAFGAPHAPLQAPPELEARFEAIEDSDRRTYAAMVASLDAGVGRVLAALEERGLARDTVVWFLSDNGADETLGGSNDPLREGKGTCFEGGVRVPAALRWPGGLAGGREEHATLSVLDVLPTFARWAGLPAERLGELDGLDVGPVLAGDAPAPERELFFAVEHRKWSELALRAGDWKLVRVFRPPWQDPVDHLFDVAADPLEERDLAAAEPARRAALAERLEAWNALHPDDALRYSRRAPEGFEPPEDWATDR